MPGPPLNHHWPPLNHQPPRLRPQPWFCQHRRHHHLRHFWRYPYRRRRPRRSSRFRCRRRRSGHPSRSRCRHRRPRRSWSSRCRRPHLQHSWPRVATVSAVCTARLAALRAGFAVCGGFPLRIGVATGCVAAFAAVGALRAAILRASVSRAPVVSATATACLSARCRGGRFAVTARAAVPYPALAIAPLAGATSTALPTGTSRTTVGDIADTADRIAAHRRGQLAQRDDFGVERTAVQTLADRR